MRPRRIGAYRWTPRTDTWQWNAAMFALHGYEAGAVTPTRALLLAHKHRADRAHAAAILADTVTRGTDYACRHRVVAFDGQVRDVLALDWACRDAEVPVRHGYLIDVTASDGRQFPPEDGTGRALGALQTHLPLTHEAAVDLIDQVALTRRTTAHTVAERVVRAATVREEHPTPRAALLALLEPRTPHHLPT